LPGLLRLLGSKSLKRLNHFVVGNLPKIAVIIADCTQKIFIMEADDIVGIRFQRRQSIARPHGHGENQPLRIARACCLQSRARRCAGGNAIVHHDSGAAGDINTRAVS